MHGRIHKGTCYLFRSLLSSFPVFPRQTKHFWSGGHAKDNSWYETNGVHHVENASSNFPNRSLVSWGSFQAIIILYYSLCTKIHGNQLSFGLVLVWHWMNAMQWNHDYQHSEMQRKHEGVCPSMAAGCNRLFWNRIQTRTLTEQWNEADQDMQIIKYWQELELGHAPTQTRCFFIRSTYFLCHLNSKRGWQLFVLYDLRAIWRNQSVLKTDNPYFPLTDSETFKGQVR